MVTMPFFTANSLTSEMAGDFKINFSISSSIIKASKIPILPLYPVLLHLLQPTGLKISKSSPVFLIETFLGKEAKTILIL